jgi:hypothetical protein
MNIAELIAILEDYNPDLPVYIREWNSESDCEDLIPEYISTQYITVVDEDEEEDTEIKALVLGEME